MAAHAQVRVGAQGSVPRCMRLRLRAPPGLHARLRLLQGVCEVSGVHAPVRACSGARTPRCSPTRPSTRVLMHTCPGSHIVQPSWASLCMRSFCNDFEESVAISHDTISDYRGI